MDALSWISQTELNAISEVRLNKRVLDQLKREYQSSEMCADILKKPSEFPDFQAVRIYHTTSGLLRLYTPEGSLKEKIIAHCHESAFAGHFAVKRTLALVTHTFYWPSVRDDVEVFVLS